jgi:Holliday junction resolvasome RuvABC endonuclease subunit
VVGLDLSLRCSAAVFLPASWSPREPAEGLRWTTVGAEVAKGDHAGQSARLHKIGRELVDFVRTTGARDVFVEGAAFNQSAFAGVQLGELAGAVKYALFDDDRIVVVPVNMQRARKLFIGGEKLPKGSASIVAKLVLEMGFPWETSDPGDALCVANYGRGELGMDVMVCG